MCRKQLNQEIWYLEKKKKPEEATKDEIKELKEENAGGEQVIVQNSDCYIF